MNLPIVARTHEPTPQRFRTFLQILDQRVKKRTATDWDRMTTDKLTLMGIPSDRTGEWSGMNDRRATRFPTRS